MMTIEGYKKIYDKANEEFTKFSRKIFCLDRDGTSIPVIDIVPALQRLYEYEETNMSPKAIADLIEDYKDVCEKVEELTKELEAYRKTGSTPDEVALCKYKLRDYELTGLSPKGVRDMIFDRVLEDTQKGKIAKITIETGNGTFVVEGKVYEKES